MVAVVVPSLSDTGGVISVARFLQQVLRQRSDFETRFVSLATSARDSVSVLLRNPRTWLRGIATSAGNFNGDPFIHVGAQFAEFEFRRYAPRGELARLLVDCDLVQVIAGAPAWVLPVAGCGKPIILQVATLARIERRGQRPASDHLHGLWRRVMTRITAHRDDAGLRAANAIMVENAWMFEYARAVTSGGDTIVRHAPPGLDVDVFRPAVVRNLEHGSYMLAVGRFSDSRKNGTLLLSAFARLLSRTSRSLRLMIASTDEPGDAFRKMVIAAGLVDKVIIRLHPSEEELARLYRDAVCFALSSNEEGLGIVVLEAMASGIPVVATRCGGPEGVITDGVDGFLVPIGDADTMAGRLAELVDNPEVNREMGTRARLTIERRYSTAVAGQAYLDIYRSLLAAKRSD